MAQQQSKTRHRPEYEVEDIVVEILSRLPVKSLKRFQCVCKSWCDLISDSFFVMKHANHAKKDPKSLKVLVSIEPPQSVDYEALLKHEDDDGHVASRQLKLDLSKCCPAMLRSCHLYVVGSCNGLICLHGVDMSRDYSDILLWNPCTGDTCVLPEHTNLFRAHYGYHHPMFYGGFGYDSTTEDYKVILGDSYICDYDDDGAFKILNKVAVFTLKTGSWRNYYEERRVNRSNERRSIRLAGQGCLSNGALHWMELVFDYRFCLNGSSSRIMSFDLAREKFQEMVSLSSFVDKECLDHISASYGTLVGTTIGPFAGIGSTIENNLLVYFYVPSINTSDTTLTIWVMNEYGVKASWTKLLHFTPKISIVQKYPAGLHDCLFPVSILENGEVLMSCNEHELVLYNPKEKMNKTVLVTNFPCEGIMYAETLITPVIGGEVDVCNQKCGDAEASKTQIDYFATSCLSLDTPVMSVGKKPWKLRVQGPTS